MDHDSSKHPKPPPAKKTRSEANATVLPEEPSTPHDLRLISGDLDPAMTPPDEDDEALLP